MDKECFTDMTCTEQDAVLDNASVDELKKICSSLAYSYKNVAGIEDFYNHPEMAMKME